MIREQVALITGGTSGIGKAIAINYAKNGAKLALFGTNAEKGDRALAELAKLAPNCEVDFWQVDVSDNESVQKAINEVVDRFGEIDILVNCAGVTRDNLLLRMKESDWDRVLDVNLKSCYNTCKAVIRPMMKKRSGSIINITSVVGLMGNPGQSNYAASKAGMIGFSKALAKELASRGIRVNCIAPGYVETNMTDALNSTQQEMIIKNIPLGRIGQPEEISHAALFLASDWANYITGQVLTVDGGMVI